MEDKLVSPGKKQLVAKSAEVDIKNITTAMLPNQLGGMGIMVIGLGEDNAVYTWDSRTREWMES